MVSAALALGTFGVVAATDDAVAACVVDEASPVEAVDPAAPSPVSSPIEETSRIRVTRAAPSSTRRRSVIAPAAINVWYLNAVCGGVLICF